MDHKAAIRAKEILEELEGLRKYKGLLENREFKSVAHFEFVQNYRSLNSYERVVIDKKHNPRFIAEVEKIIAELETELQSL